MAGPIKPLRRGEVPWMLKALSAGTVAIARELGVPGLYLVKAATGRPLWRIRQCDVAPFEEWLASHGAGMRQTSVPGTPQ